MANNNVAKNAANTAKAKEAKVVFTGNVITDSKLLDKESKLLARQIGNQDNRIWAYLISEIAHIGQHNNPTRLNEFFKKISKAGVRRAAMSAYVQKFGNVTVEKGVFVYAKGKKANVEGAKAVHWTSFKPEGQLVAFDLVSQVKSLIERAVNMAADESRAKVGDNIDMSTLEALMAATGYRPEAKRELTEDEKTEAKLIKNAAKANEALAKHNAAKAAATKEVANTEQAVG